MRKVKNSPASATVDAEKDRQKGVRSKRGRRLLAAIITILVLSLIGISVLLLSMIIPRSNEVADKEEANGLIWVKSIYGWGDAVDQRLYLPRRLTIDANGTIWTTDSQYKEVFAFSPEGTLDGRYGNSVTDQMVGFGPVAIGPENAVYLGEPEMDRVRVLSATGEDLGAFPIPSPTDIEYRAGTMVVTSESGFAFVDPNDGRPLKVVGQKGQGVGEFDTVGGLTIGPDGTVYIVDTYNNRLEAFDGEGNQLWSVQTGAPGNKVDVTGAANVQASQITSAPAKLQTPSDVTMDGNGRLVVVDPFGFSVSVFDAKNGKFIKKYGADGRKDGQLNYPSAIAYDAERDWFAIADTGNHRVQIVRIPGSAPFSAQSAAKRSLSGPLRACLAPLVLLLLAIIVAVVRRRAKKKRQGQDGAVAPLTENLNQSV